MSKHVPKNQRNSELESGATGQIEATAPGLDPELAALHEEACRKGERFYLDPRLQQWVTTRQAHLQRGYCCGNGCRHCPWDHQAVYRPPGSRIPEKK